MSFHRKLQKIGNSVGAIIPKPVRELLGWDDDIEIEYSTAGNKLTLQPAPKKQEQDIDLLGDIE